MYILLLALAPVLILMTYVYFRDKYEKEPVKLILKGILMGAIIIFPVGFVENAIIGYGEHFNRIGKAAWDGFIVAGATEEAFKFLMVLILIWRNRNFNEKFDGIVYSVSVGLGFAGIENLFYVFSNSNYIQISLLRAFTAVPAHTIFGILMGFYLGMAKFSVLKRQTWLIKAFLIPWFLHGVYDFLLMSGHPLLLLTFIPFLLYMYRIGLKRMKEFNAESVFNPVNINFDQHQTNPSGQENKENTTY